MVYWDLIKKGANINCRDQIGRTPLFHAVSKSGSSSEIIEYLLLRGLDPVARDNAGKTPLSLSITYAFLTGLSLGSSAITDGKDVLRRVFRSSNYHTACLLLHYGLDSMIKDVDMRAE